MDAARTFFGPLRIRYFFAAVWPSKVRAYLQWARVARSGEKIPLFVNMDETSMKLHFGRAKGLMVTKQSLPLGKQRRKEQVSSSDGKANLSFLTFLTHDASIQPKLPQILLGNKHVLTLSMVHVLHTKKPANFHLWREESSWNSHKLMRRAMTLLMRSLEEYTDSHQVVLVMDVARSHFHYSITAHANRLGLRLLYVPAKLTWLLQPADTHCFRRLKAKLRQRWLELATESETGKITHTEWVLAVFEVANGVLCGVRWLPAFKGAGLLGEFGLSAKVLEQLGWESPQSVPSASLSQEQLKCVFPRRSKVNRDTLFKWALTPGTPKAKPKAKEAESCVAASSADSYPLVSEGPISSRTRKRCKTTP